MLIGLTVVIAGDMSSIPGSGNPLEEEMTTHSSILAWRFHGQRSLATVPGVPKNQTRLK